MRGIAEDIRFALRIAAHRPAFTAVVVVALVACWIPAHRVSRLEPMAVLRYQ